MRVLLLSNSKVVSIKNVLDDYVLEENEIQSDTGELGQIMQPDGSFITPDPVPVTPTPTLEEQVQSLKDDNLILMDVLATMYEDMLAKGTV